MALTKSGKDLNCSIARVFADASPKELQIRESVLKKAGKRARALAGREKPDNQFMIGRCKTSEAL